MRSNYPDIWSQFACKGGTCRRTCCRHDWNVVMSRAEYERATDPGLPADLRALAEAHIRPNPRATGDADLAYVEMVGDVDCPLLDDAGRCRWRARAGAHLCSTCDSFPCTTMLYRGQEYLMPSCGCEAVVEALLHREDPIRMVAVDPGAEVGEKTAGERSYYVHIADELVAQRPLLGWYPQLVEFGLAVLQDRSLRLDDRVARLLEGLARIDRLETTGRLDLLPGFLKGLAAPASSSGSGSGPVGAGSNPTVPWLPVFVCGEVFSHYCHSSAHVPCARRILEGLGVGLREVRGEDGAPHVLPTPGTSERVYPAKRAAFDGFFARREVFFEHVAVSLYLKMLMPVREPGVWAHATYFAAMYAAVKGGLVGYCAPEEPADEQLVNVLVEIVRMGTHSELMYPTVCTRMRAARVDSLEALQALVRS